MAPRFDLATEVLVLSLDETGENADERIVVLPHSSAEKLCHMVLTEGIETVVCGGIEDEYYQYMKWKRIKVIDSVIGPWKAVADAFLTGNLEPGAII